VCTLCTALSTSPVGSTASTQCSCNAGSTGPSGRPCSVCQAGKYKVLSGSAVCDDCVAGKFSTGTGQSSSTTCQNCLAGKYSIATGQSSSATCQDCPAQSTSPAGSSADTSCLCNAGYSGTAGTCTQCSANTYKATTGSEACSLCPGNSISAAGSTTQSSCSCVAGYTGPNGGPCVACARGKYKSSPGSGVCTDCPALQYNWILGSTSIMDCVCFAGYSGPDGGGPCTVCPYSYGSGTWKPQLRSGACEQMTDSCWNPCEPGYYRAGVDSCGVCPPDTYRDYWHCSKCNPCPTDTSNMHLPYPGTGDNKRLTISQCLPSPCPAGKTGPTGGPCIKCEQGKYKQSIGSEPCTSCPVVWYKRQDNSHYEAMTTHPDVMPVNSDYCQCKLGYDKKYLHIEYGYQVCQACETGKAKWFLTTSSDTFCGTENCCQTCGPSWSTYRREPDYPDVHRVAAVNCSCAKGLFGNN
jgi:hypothetical protein